jgi:hypothetical protein
MRSKYLITWLIQCYVYRLPGRAFARGGHVWLSRASEVDSKVFSRAILAKALLFSYFSLNYWLIGT